MAKSKPLYPDPLDSAYEFYFKPEADRPYPFFYKFVIRDLDTGSIIDYSDSQCEWAQYPIQSSDDWNDGNRILDDETEYATQIDVERLMERTGKTGGEFLISAHIVNQSDINQKLLEREQSQYLIVINKGLKPPSLP
jgi:hypothetical protein